jgi:hypothetical protein
MCVTIAMAVFAKGETLAYWSFDNNQEMARSLGSQGTLNISPEGWFTERSFPSGGTDINRINYGQTSYEYMQIDDPISFFTVGKIEITDLNLTGISGLELSFAAYISDFISLEFSREVVCYVNDTEVWRQEFDVSTSNWELVTVDLPSAIDNQSNVKVEMLFYDSFNCAYHLHLDNVLLTIPDPASATAMLISGGLLMVRRRKHNR